MTPYDIYRKWLDDISYVAPELLNVKLSMTKWSIRKVEAIFDQGPNCEAGAEAVEVLRRLRRYETALRLYM